MIITSALCAGSPGLSDSFGPGLPSSKEEILISILIMIMIIKMMMMMIIIIMDICCGLTLMKCLALLRSPSVVCRELSLPTGT